jgi:transcriptional regulator with XRE-family HTH domain
VNPDVEAVRELDDPLKQAQQASELLTQYQAAVTELSHIRREAIELLMAQGMTRAQLAERLGMTRARVGQLLAAGPRSERLFLGTGPLTVALGGKLEAGKPDPGPVVSQEGLQAYERLRELALTLGLEAEHEIIHPPGLVDLNRDNLVVICGPRLSPVVAQVLASDPNLSFEHDQLGWYLVDHATGTTYRSPRDSGEPSDYAYLGRLPRIDGRGSFLYFAGIHAPGNSGVVHYLESHLEELYGEVRTGRFSTLIACRFDPDTREITSSQRVTPLYRADARP